MANITGTADHSRTTARETFRYKQDDPAKFADLRKRMRRSDYTNYTYFMWDCYSHLVKIGKSIDPLRRVAELGSSGERKIELLVVLRGGWLEAIYHQHFADLRVKGEWFEPHADLIDEIVRLRPESDPCDYPSGPISLAAI